MANISSFVILEMLFLTLSSINIDFPKRELQWRYYTTEQAFLTIKLVELVRKKEFAVAALNPGYNTFVVYIASFESFRNNQESNIYLFCRVQITALIANEAPNSIFIEYSEFTDGFSPKLASELFEHTEINDHAIELVDDW